MSSLATLKQLRHTGEYSDLTVVCGDQTFHVHKAIMCSGSPWFKSACQKDRWMEGTTDTIELKAIEVPSSGAKRCKTSIETLQDEEGGGEDYSCDDPDAVRLMIDFLYHGSYSVESVLAGLLTPEIENECVRRSRVPRPSTSSKRKKSSMSQPAAPGALTLHARLYALGRKCGIDGLQEAAVCGVKGATDYLPDAADLAAAIRIAGHTADDVQDSLLVTIKRILVDFAAYFVYHEEIAAAVNAIEGLAWACFVAKSRG